MSTGVVVPLRRRLDPFACCDQPRRCWHAADIERRVAALTTRRRGPAPR